MRRPGVIERLFREGVALYAEEDLYSRVGDETREYLIKIVERNRLGRLATVPDLAGIGEKMDMSHRDALRELKEKGLVAEIELIDLKKKYDIDRPHVSVGLKEAVSIPDSRGRKKYYVAMLRNGDGTPLYSDFLK